MRHKKFKIGKLNSEIYLKKLYEFKNESWDLPKEIFIEEKWSIPELQERKRNLNSVKEQLNDFNLESWSQHTRNRDPSSPIIQLIRRKYQPELLTQAWCKFYECLSSTNLLPESITISGQLKSLHLCEAPGGFVSALNHYLVLHNRNIKLSWYASTLNPNYEGNSLSHMIPDDRLIRFTKDNWLFGADHTGDIIKYYNHKFIVDKIVETGRVNLVTADGSIDCMYDPGNQEKHVEFLHYCETMTALAVLEIGGTFVLKIFTIFEESTVCLMYLLNICFEKVSIFKPITSKSGNSETYVICKLYKGFGILSSIWINLIKPYETTTNKMSMFKLCDLNNDFLKQICECADFFMEKQIATINNNISNYMQEIPHEIAKFKNINLELRNQFFKQYYLDRISNEDKIVSHINITSCFRKLQYNEEGFVFQLYQNHLNVPKLEIQLGKRITKIFYSKYCTKEVLENIKFQSRTGDSLFNKSLRAMEERKINVIQYSDFVNSVDQSDFQKQLFYVINEKLKADNNSLIFVNIPFVSDFMVGLLFLLAISYKNLYFLKSGLIYISNCDKNRKNKVIELFAEIDKVFRELDTMINENFPQSILQILNIEFDVHYNNCVWFFNNNLVIS